MLTLEHKTRKYLPYLSKRLIIDTIKQMLLYTRISEDTTDIQAGKESGYDVCEKGRMVDIKSEFK